MLTQAELKSLLHYDPETGLFTWIKRLSNRVKIGSIAGTKHSAGYWTISINGKPYLSHRLAWFYMTGEWPEFEIDHRDRDRSNARFLNLRKATHQENLRNTGMFSHNTSGKRGVYKRKDTGRWAAQVKINGKHKSLGCYPSLELASQAYQNFVTKEYGEFHHKLEKATLLTDKEFQHVA